MSGAAPKHNNQSHYEIVSDSDSDEKIKKKNRKPNKLSSLTGKLGDTHLKTTPEKSHPPSPKRMPIHQNMGAQNRLAVPLERKRSRSSSVSNHPSSSGAKSRKRSPSPNFIREDRTTMTRSKSPIADKSVPKTLNRDLGNFSKQALNFDSGKKRKMSADDWDNRTTKKLKEVKKDQAVQKQNDEIEIKSNKKNSSDNSDLDGPTEPLVLSSNFSNTFDQIHQPFIYKVYQLPRDRTKVFWIYPFYTLEKAIRLLNDTNEEDLKPSMDYSEEFQTQNGWSWKFIRRIYPSDIQKVYFGLASYTDEQEHYSENWKRYISGYISGYQTSEKQEKKRSINPPKFISESEPELSIDFKTGSMDLDVSGQFVIECLIKSTRASNYDSKQATSYVGLVNAGNTCYMNSFLQTIYLISALTRAVLKLPYKAEKDEDEEREFTMTEALQKLFFNLKYSNKAVSTTELIRSFGWDTRDAWIQHDVQEFKCVLLDALEREMNRTKELENEIPRLLGGRLESYIECIYVRHESKREEIFYDLLLSVKGSSNIKEALKSFLDVEILDGDNKYDAEKLGKQDARKGIRLKAIPPILIFQLKRFYYDHAREKNIKITDRCEYTEEIDLAEFIQPPNKTCTQYKLFSVLVHCGEGSSSGHYYAFVRPKMKKWYKFDDDFVECASDMQVFDQNFGGEYEEGNYDKFSGKIETKKHLSITTAYMLFYIRKDEIETILEEISEKEIPKHLFDFAERTRIEEEERKKKNETIKVFITTIPLLKKFSKSRGIIYNKEGVKDDEYKWRFIKSKEYRYLWRVSKLITCKEFIEELSKISGWNQEQFVVYKILYNNDRAKLVPVNKLIRKNSVNSGVSLKNTYLGNGFNPNATPYPVLLMVPLIETNKDYFKDKAKANEDEDNVLEFETQGPPVDNFKMNDENFYESVLQENHLFCFVKAYYFDGETNSYHLELISHRLYLKDKILLEIQSELKTFVREYYKLKQQNVSLDVFKEDSEQKLIEECDGSSKLTTNGTVFVVQIHDHEKQKNNFLSVQDYYEREQNKVKVTFICDSEDLKMDLILRMDMNGIELTDFLSKKFFKGKHPGNRIIFKTCEHLKKVYKELIPTEEKRLSDMIKFDDKIYVEISPLSVEELREKFELKLHFLSKTNQYSNQKKIICSNKIICEELLAKIIRDKIFDEEMAMDNNTSKSLRIVMIDSKKKIMSLHTRKYFPFHPVFELIQKGSIRIESHDEPVDENTENNILIFCSHTQKEGEVFENSFILRIDRTVRVKQLLELLYNKLKDRKMEFEKKPIAFSKEYFDKLKLFLKTDVNSPSPKQLNSEPPEALIANYKKADTSVRFYLEIQHMQFSNSSNALKINH